MEENKQVLDEALQLVDDATDEELDDMPDFFKEREKRNRIARFERNGINLNDTKESVKEVVKGDTPAETLSEMVNGEDKPLRSRALPEPDDFLAKKEEEIKAMAEESKEKLNKLTEETIDKLKDIHKETSETIKGTLKAMEESINKTEGEVSKKVTEVKTDLDTKASEVKDKAVKVAKDVKEAVVGDDGKLDKEDVDRLSKEAITALASIAGNAEKLFGMLRRELEKMEKGQNGKTGN